MEEHYAWEKAGGRRYANVSEVIEDGKEVKLDTSKMGISDVVEECDRHSRTLQRKDALTG